MELRLRAINVFMAVGMAILCQIGAVGMMDPLDFLALQSIRKALEDLPNSHFFSSWDFTSEPCDFTGVFCDGDDKIIALTLGDPRAGLPGLTGIIDPAIGNLTSLTEFTVVPGRISGEIPESISNLKHLRFLGISRNWISGEIPSTIAQLRDLKTLDLSYNGINGSIPSSIGTLPSLINLILCQNRLSGSVPTFASETLIRLDLNRNDLSGSLCSTTFPPSLQYLSLSRNRLSGPVEELLNRLRNLNYLDLSVNGFTGNIPNTIFAFPITSLHLQRNAFSGTIQPSTSQVTIDTVDLSYNRLTGVISPLFSSVHSLYLNNNRFTGQVPGSFVDRLLAASIQILYLQHNFLTGMEIDPEATIPITTAFCLQYNCMVPPLQTPCPLKGGKRKTRPSKQCAEWKG